MTSTKPEGAGAPPPPPGERPTEALRPSVEERRRAPGDAATTPAAGSPAGSAGSADAAGPADPRSVGGPRRVRLSISRIDPWSAMKLSFLLSVAAGIMIVVAAAVVWFVLDSMHVFADIEELISSVDSQNFLRLMDYLEFDRVMSFATIIAVVDVLLLTALGTIGAFLYNIVAALVGGLHLTLTDD